MTFIPSVLSKNDPNNSTNGSVSSTYVGTISSTIGYNSIQIVVESSIDSAPSGVVISFYSDIAKTNKIQDYSDTYYANSLFGKAYPVEGPFYQVVYTPSSTSPSPTLKINSRLQSTGYDPASNNLSIFNNLTEYQQDAFGKLRFTQPETLLDLKLPSNSDTDPSTLNFRQNFEQMYSVTYGNATTTFGSSKCIMQITGTGTANSFISNQSRVFTPYQPGKSLLILCSGKIDPQTDGVLPSVGDTSTCTARIGYFNTNTTPTTATLGQGLYFQCVSTRTRSATNTYTMSTTVSVNYSSTGSPISIPQSSWNVDKLDGSGTSGINLDFTKCQLFVIDLEWLGVGRVRYGFYVYGKIIYCHQVTNFNILNEPYISHINLPLCFYLQRDQANGEGSITQVCATVISEGGYTPLGRPFTINDGLAGISLTANTETPLLLLRGGSTTYNHQNIVPSSISIFLTGANDIALYKMYIFQAPNKPCLNDSDITWTDVNSTYSVSQYSTAITNPILTSGIMVQSEYLNGKTTVKLGTLDNIFNDQILHITANSSNISDILVLTCTCKTNTTAYASITWSEIY